LCIAGLIRKAAVIIEGRNQGLRFPVFQINGEETGPLTLTGRNPVLAVMSVLFHISIIAAPLTARGHGIMLDLSWGFFPPRFNPLFTSIFTALAMTSGSFLLLRRIFVKHVRSVSTWRDYAAMICVLIPFITGMMARKGIGVYETVMLIHFTGAHIILVATGWTRLGHMVFFTAAFFVTSGFRKGGAA